ncbi:fructosamine kinase family protein [Microbacterium timonense]|uniref:fructosamine kinase family protein n=1 Tax=Microbacterium timonense TaxID=2086576 RepID=UPI00135A2252|nr:fructosamine kinase family protein [Microbacterium timonense]
MLPPAVGDFLRNEGGHVIDFTRLTGGEISSTYRLRTTKGFSAVLKTSNAAPADMYLREAAGLAALRGVGALRAPDVYLVGHDHLLLEDLGVSEKTEENWEAYGRALAAQHQTVGPWFGWAEDNYLGTLPQLNTPTADGHEFFARLRILRYLDTPRCAEAFDGDDRRAIEGLAERLPQLVRAHDPVLLHGDLWRENMIAQQRPAAIDPAVHYGWATAELAMVQQCGGVPDVFFAAYREAAGMKDDREWAQELDVLSIREHLSAVAHQGDRDAADRARQISRRFG